MYQNIKVLFSNPIVNFFLGTLVAVACLYISLNKTEISYSISSSETLVSKKEGLPELTFLWNNNEINKDLKRVKVAIWNSGNTYIDFLSFSKSQRFKLSLTNKASIVSHKISSLSRDNLDINSTFKDDKSFIVFDFRGDDALEPNDGFIVSVFYVGDDIPEIELLGRVKGTGSDFNIVTWSSIKSSLSESSNKTLYFLFFIFCTGLVLLLPLFEFEVSKQTVMAYHGVISLLGFVYIGFALGPLLGFINLLYFGLPWII